VIGRQQLLYCERFVELLTDVLAQLPTRRLMAAVVEDFAVLVKCRMSHLMTHPQGGSPHPLLSPRKANV
jgi:intron-binding protein aquarius